MWIESHQSLGTHLKLTRLATTLEISRPQAVGHLHYLWWWALDNAPDGDLSQLSDAEIAEVSRWEGDPAKFAAALKQQGWLDDDGQIHDWQDYAGRLVEKRRHDRIRKAKMRRKSGGSPAPVRVSSASRPLDVQRTSDGHPEDGAGTEPNRTEPNHITPPSARAREGTSQVPSEDEVLAWARQWPGDAARGIPAGIPEQWVLGWMAVRFAPGKPPLVGWQDEARRRFVADWIGMHPKARPAVSGPSKSGAVAGPKGEGETARRMRLERLVEERLRGLDEARRLRDEGHPGGDKLVADARQSLADAEAQLKAATAGAPAEVAA